MLNNNLKLLDRYKWRLDSLLNFLSERLSGNIIIQIESNRIYSYDSEDLMLCMQVTLADWCDFLNFLSYLKPTSEKPTNAKCKGRKHLTRTQNKTYTLCNTALSKQDFVDIGIQEELDICFMKASVKMKMNLVKTYQCEYVSVTHLLCSTGGIMD